MKPNFALSLAQDGIRLLHRAPGGWQLVGEADFQNGDLAAQLERMRSTAIGLEPDGFRCKIVIPDDQIKYIETPIGDSDDFDRLAAAALEGTTPYDVTELVYDTHVSGQTLQIAAVARETLSEAAEFTTQNQFNPATYVADPAEADFAGEPVFSTGTQLTVEDASDQTITPDALPISRDTDPLEELANYDAPGDETVSFISRRTVPTFRTDPDHVLVGENQVGVDGFAEPDAPYRAKPKAAASQNKTGKARNATHEDRQMTVFGARERSALAGRRDSLIRVAAVVTVVTLGIAGFASGMFNNGWDAVFNRSAGPEPEVRFAAPLQPDEPEAQANESPAIPQKDVPPRDTALSDEDAAVLDALALATPPTELKAPAQEVVPPTAAAVSAPTPDDVQAYYAVFGIWPKAPDVPTPSALVDLNDFYISGSDKDQPQLDAVALPALASYQHDAPLLSPASPAPAGTRFSLDARGMVIPTPEGALNADGIPVISGPPPLRPPPTLVRIETPGDDLERRQRLSPFRPVARPGDLVQQDGGSGLDASRRAELATLRPRIRPASAQENALAAASLVSLDADGALIRDAESAEGVAPSARAVRASLRPDARPSNFGAIVARAQRNAQPAPEATVTRVAPRAVSPSIPSSASTTRAATQRNAINLRRVNLIGVYGTPSSRRALVRLGNGRYQKVAVGDRIDGGRVSAIGESELRYQKSGRSVVLKMPRG